MTQTQEAPVETHEEQTDEQIKAELFDKSEKLWAEVATMDSEIDDLTEKRKKLNKNRETKIDEIKELSQQLRQPDMPLFEKERLKKEGKDEAWRTVPIETLQQYHDGFSDSLVGKLLEYPLKTIGDLADFGKSEFNQLTNIKGIGEAKAEIIEASLEEYWKANPVGQDGEDVDEPWRTVPIGALQQYRLSGAVTKGLQEHEIKTLGDLADFRKSEFNKLTDIKGIGDTEAANIEASVQEYWEAGGLFEVQPNPVEESAE